jgi:hypothetical protein
VSSNPATTLPSVPISDSRRRFLKRPLTETERNWLLSLLVVLGSVGVFAIGYLIELEMGRWKDSIRLVRDPSESSMRFLALSHFFVAALYMSTSRRMRSVRSWAWVGTSLVVGIVLCLGWSRLMLINPLFGTTLFFSYFLVHDYRDQVFFYFVNGDSKQRDSSLARLLAAAPLVIIGSGVALLTAAGAFGLPGTQDVVPAFGNLSMTARAILGTLVVAGTVTALVIFGSLVKKRRGETSLREFVSMHRPILYVFAGSVLVLGVSALVGASGDAIILLHVCSWYVFTMRQLQKRPPATRPPAFSWNWMRSTLAGFNFVHIGSFILFLVAGAIWSFSFHNDPSMTGFATVLGRVMFPYWTILHVTVSFPGR